MFYHQKETLPEALGMTESEYQREWDEIIKSFNESSSPSEFKEKLKKVPNIVLAAGVERMIYDITHTVPPRLFHEYLPCVFKLMEILITSTSQQFQSRSQVVEFIAQFPKDYLIMLIWFFFSEMGKLGKLVSLLPLKGE